MTPEIEMAPTVVVECLDRVIKTYEFFIKQDFAVDSQHEDATNDLHALQVARRMVGRLFISGTFK